MRAVNLIPAEQRGGGSVGVGRSGGGAYAVMVLLAGLAVLAFFYGTAHHQISSRRAQAASLTTQAAQAQAAATRLAPYTTFIALREARMQAVSQLVNSRFDWAHAFHELGRVLPPGAISISSLSGAIGSTTSTAAAAPAAPAATAAPAAGATPTGTAGSAAASSVTSATPPGAVPSFTLSGCATSQPAVAVMLERLRLIDGVSEVVLQSSTKSSPGASTGGSGGGCPTSAATFTVEVNFDPLPTASAVSSATKAKTVADTTKGAVR
jgi:hypothetical protein